MHLNTHTQIEYTLGEFFHVLLFEKLIIEK
jgi:hypothetical protein